MVPWVQSPVSRKKEKEGKKERRRGERERGER
jgi:hypothetical protein